MDKYQELIQSGKPFLKEYLQEMGVEVVKKGATEFFCCIHPDHNDHNPSSNLMKSANNEQFHCFSCLASGDIYTAAHLLEGKPLYGLAFLKDNLEYILNRYNVSYEPVELTEEQLSRFKYEAAYNSAYDLIIALGQDGELIHSDLTYAKERGWNETTCRTLGIGSIKDYHKFVTHLSKITQIPINQLSQMGIKEDLFNPNNLTFTIKDHNDKVSGFACRNTKWIKNSPDPKYINTSIEDNPFYRKDQQLYCIHKAKKYKDLRLDIFEGYGSAVTAHQNNYHNCVAIGGTALTDNHVRLIRDLGFRHVNLILDADSTGIEKMDKYMEKFSGYTGLEITITYLPLTEEDLQTPGNNDPDYFIKKYGIEEFRKIRPTNLFEHMLHKTGQFEPGDPLSLQFCKKMIPLIINEPDLIKRGSMVLSLATHTGADKEDIKDEIKRLEKADISKLKDDVIKRVKNVNDPDSLQDVLNKAAFTIDDIASSKKDRHLISVSETVDVFDSIYSELITLPEGIHGWVTEFDPLNDLMDGIPKPGKNGGRAIGFAGAPQSGKSAAMLNIALSVARNNKDVTILYWAIDDHRKAIFYRLIAMISGLPMKKINNSERRSEEDCAIIKSAYDELRTLVVEKRLIFKDDGFGRSKSRAESWIRHTQDDTGNQILFCVDSMHNIQGNDGQETRTKLITSSTWLKSLCSIIPCTVMATLELIKNKQKGAKPTLQDISESGKMEFDFDTMAVVWNESQGNYTDVSMVNAKWGSPGNWNPIIEIDFQKNKAGAGQKGSIYFKYDTKTTKFIDCSRNISVISAPPLDLTNGFTTPEGIVFGLGSKKRSDTGW